jgi:hypothetical protein
MTQDEIIEMARQAGVRDDERIFEFSQYKYLEAFANLVADKATEEANAKANASWTLMCKKMVAFEREACAVLCDAEQEGEGLWYGCALYLAEKIRARGEQA